jgi:hypothetical protein
MKVKDLVAAIQAKPPTPAQLKTAAATMHVSLEGLMVQVAKDIAESYMSGAYSWAFADAAMMNLYATANGPARLAFPQFAFDVYVAFDEGESKHRDNPALDGESRTKELLKPLLGGIRS